MRIVTIESPLAGDFERNIRYARWCLRDSLLLDEAPFASQLFYPQCFDDATPEARAIGMLAGREYIRLADAVVCYVDLGISSGMRAAQDAAIALVTPIEIRRLQTPDFQMCPARRRGPRENRSI
jgi:hypothetical protein